MTPTPDDTLDLIRRRLVNVVGHELRTPLTTIRGLADLLATADEDELRATLIPALVRNARRAERLLDDLLIAGGITAAAPTVPPSTIRLDEVLRSAMAGLGDGDPSEDQVDIHVADSDVDTTVVAHADSAIGACARLLENAISYSVSTPQVRFEVDATAVTMVVETPVQGVVANLELAFELFFRGEQAVTAAAGLGVGLPVARSLARLDGGDVDIEQVGGDVVSRLRLPRPERTS